MLVFVWWPVLINTLWDLAEYWLSPGPDCEQSLIEIWTLAIKIIVSPGWTTKHSNWLFVQVGSVRLCFFACFFLHEDMTLSMAKMISLSKTRLGIHETKQENRDSDNDLFLCLSTSKKFDEWGLFNFRCCLKLGEFCADVWDGHLWRWGWLYIPQPLEILLDSSVFYKPYDKYIEKILKNHHMI